MDSVVPIHNQPSVDLQEITSIMEQVPQVVPDPPIALEMTETIEKYIFIDITY